MSRGRIVLVVSGALLALIGFALTVAGGALLWAHVMERDDAGFYATGPHELTTDSYAITSESLDLRTDVREADWAPFDELGTARIAAESPAGTAVFLGIADVRDVERYLDGVAHDELTDVSLSPFDPEYQRHVGTEPSEPPQGLPIWVASVAGEGTQTLDWEIESGDWMVVLMNADGAAGVAADVTAGVKTDLLLPIGLGIGVFGLLVLAGATTMLILGLRHAAGPTVTREIVLEPEAEVGERTYPARLDGHLDPQLSRWLWLVKFVLVIPHLVVLAFLWLAVFVLTVVAGVNILFTGRYPRALFDFNVGVMRWTWRVAFYSFSAFGTDQYPPFSLQPDPAYPASFDVDRPERLSRGLVLVKWWLLAIPHYLIVGIFAGGWGVGWREDSWVFGSGGLISVVAFVAVVMLAIRGRYPRELFHFVMGLNRWAFRVLAYVALMRDEYPPFRFDGGGTDPGSVRREHPEPPTPEPEQQAPEPHVPVSQ